MPIRPVCTPQYRGNLASGAMIISLATGQFLFGLRGKDCDAPDVWGTFGGGVEAGESLAGALKRELFEETGFCGDVYIRPLWSQKRESFTYHTHIAVVRTNFEPLLNDETQSAMWCNLNDWPLPLHPGLAACLKDTQVRTILESYVARQRSGTLSMLLDAVDNKESLPKIEA